MENQLLRKYLVGKRLTHGVYLVGWFYCEKWEPKNRGRRDKSGWGERTLEEARAFFRDQAERLSEEAGRTIKACILDARL
jgi:hypothetical protein